MLRNFLHHSIKPIHCSSKLARGRLSWLSLRARTVINSHVHVHYSSCFALIIYSLWLIVFGAEAEWLVRKLMTSSLVCHKLSQNIDTMSAAISTYSIVNLNLTPSTNWASSLVYRPESRQPPDSHLAPPYRTASPAVG